jgi:hypothetical protein
MINGVYASMDFKRATQNIGISNYHGQPWGVGLVNMFFFLHFHYELMLPISI